MQQVRQHKLLKDGARGHLDWASTTAHHNTTAVRYTNLSGISGDNIILFRQGTSSCVRQVSIVPLFTQLRHVPNNPSWRLYTLYCIRFYPIFHVHLGYFIATQIESVHSVVLYNLSGVVTQTSSAPRLESDSWDSPCPLDHLG